MASNRNALIRCCNNRDTYKRTFTHPHDESVMLRSKDKCCEYNAGQCFYSNEVRSLKTIPIVRSLTM